MREILSLLNPWWFGQSFKTGVERPKYIKRLVASLENRRVTLLVGSRRVGKTTLLYQLINHLLTKTNPKQIFYLLLDHPQLANERILDLVKEIRKEFLLARKEKLYLFLDEVQYLSDWEKEVKALVDLENVKIFLSGSASTMILFKTPYLTGRLEKIEVYPLDFSEFLAFKKVKVSPSETYKWEKFAEEYLQVGGYPEYVLEENPSYFSDLVNGILFKDIVSLYQLRNPEVLRDLLLLLADRVGFQTTYSKLAKIVSLKVDTVKEYLFYLKNTFLVDELPRFSSSRGARIYGPKKFYLFDNGLLFHLLGKFSFGSALEQTIFNFFKAREEKIGFYYEAKKEVDFVREVRGGIELWEGKAKIDLDFEEKRKDYYQVARLLGAKKIVFVTRDLAKRERFKNLWWEFVPLWRLLI